MAEWYVGQILTVGFSFAPVNTAKCNGQSVAISQYQALFQIIGTTYGGDGVTTFALPNLQGRRMNHQGTLPGSGGLTYVLGQNAGAIGSTLTSATMLSHGHANGSTLKASTTAATDPAAAAGSVLGTGADISGNPQLAQPAIYCPSGTATGTALAGLNVATTTANAGGSQPFSLLDPYLVINIIISLFGIFPTQN